MSNKNQTGDFYTPSHTPEQKQWLDDWVSRMLKCETFLQFTEACEHGFEYRQLDLLWAHLHLHLITSEPELGSVFTRYSELYFPTYDRRDDQFSEARERFDLYLLKKEAAKVTEQGSKEAKLNLDV